MAAAIGLVAPVVNKNYEAGESTSSIFCGELMTVLVPDVRFWEVSGKPVGAVEGFLEYLKICDRLSVHFVRNVAARDEEMHR
jgi:hypothetical protein